MSLLIDTVSRLGRVFGRSTLGGDSSDRIGRRFDALHRTAPDAPVQHRLFRS